MRPLSSMTRDEYSFIRAIDEIAFETWRSVNDMKRGRRNRRMVHATLERNDHFDRQFELVS
jgi:hypothetical protein